MGRIVQRPPGGTENTDAAFTPGIFLGNGAFLASVGWRSRSRGGRERKDGSRRWDTGSERRGRGVEGQIRYRSTAACWQLYQVTLQRPSNAHPPPPPHSTHPTNLGGSLPLSFRSLFHPLRSSFLSLSLPLCSFSRLYLPVFLPSPRFLFMPLLLALLSLPFAFMSPRPRHYRGTLHTANAHDYRIGGIMADTAGNARVDFDSDSMRDGWASILVDRVDSLKWRLSFSKQQILFFLFFSTTDGDWWLRSSLSDEFYQHLRRNYKFTNENEK